MKILLRCFLLFAAVSFSFAFHPLFCQETVNAVIPGDFADPSIIKKGNQYYAVGTSSEWAPHFPVYTSADLLDWKPAGYVFDKAPAWTSGSFWAPEYYFYNNTYFIYYTARRKTDNVSCIGVATSRYPDKGFTDHGVIIAYGKEAIDAFVYNDNGQRYITFKAFGLDERPIEILGTRLSADGLHTEGAVFSLLKDDQRIGLEGQSILKKDNYYYLFYAAGNCCGISCDYNVRVARSGSLKGPYEVYPGNPILQENAGWKCAGHGSFITANNNKHYYLHHAYNKLSGVFAGRQALLAELTWPQENGWPVFTSVATGKIDQGIHDAFKTAKIARHWQWDFRHAMPVIKQVNGNFQLSGTVTANNQTGIVATVRPSWGAFEASATVVNHNSALKGLAFYGDANSALGIGVRNDSIELWIVKDSSRTIAAVRNINGPGPIVLKISLLPDKTCRFFFKQGQDNWQEITTAEKISAGFLPQWDRSPRIGLHYKGDAGKSAVFSSFDLTY